MSQDQQSKAESKVWWQTLPGLLTAGAAALTAITGLLVALNQMGLFNHSHPSPAPVQSSAPAPERNPGLAGAQAEAANPASRPLSIPANAGTRTEQSNFTLLSARVSPYSSDQVALDLKVRMTNDGDYDANFWAASFRLSVNGSLLPPAGDLDELVPAHSAREGEIEFVVPTSASTVGLQMGTVGEGKPLIPIHLQNP